MLQKQAAYAPDERVMMMLRHWDAWDKEAGIHMYHSYGRRKWGRPPKYTVIHDNYEGGCFHLTAESLDKAIEKANKRIAKGDQFR